MFQKISAMAQGLHALLNRAEYVFSIFVWATKSLRIIADVLADFPKPHNDDKKEQSSGDVPQQNTERAQGDSQQ